MQPIEIQMLPCNASTNRVDMEHMTNIVNRSFAASEEGIWMNGADRTTVKEMTKFTSKGEIAVARSMGEIVGCVRIQRIDWETGEFGMLAVDGAYQGNGIARELVRFAEQKCQNEQMRKMQLELLIPQEFPHPAKVFLENWYNRIGYHRVYAEPFDASYPRLAQMLAVPCEFIVFQKELR
ncbi:GNAT superfamily N-acetyltransferase [Pullulanibacillus pueri]|uniref:GNAT family N-acetyltransferase n=1 Tax=Pullulanibacillus pueri TaxID=1437324 RepID=A0A8J2ZXC9_9BACL|nr:GNAT family N-acetyltransferase [Pullulanibacillus pueri]MBM7682821.1 GNAT superfamily N-acetyltransferase [Pullulanibacillus pueri]GGH83318.1 GNAT family N-acetyltransferase [Pullulanibacillus pueri]